MTRVVVIFLGLLALAVFIFVCINNNAPAIQNDIQTRTSSVLSSDSSTKWATARADGRDIILTGIAPTEESRQQAADIASSVEGVLNVDNKITVAYTSETPEIISSTPTTPVSQNSPYESEFSRNASGIVLSGSVPNQEQRKKLLRLARDKFGDGNVTDFLIIKSGAPKNWYQTASSAIKNLVLLHDGVVAITDKQVKIIGRVVDDTAKQKIEINLKNELPDQVAFNLNLDSPPPEPKAKKDGSAIQSSSCGKQFNKLVSPKTIYFSTDSTSIESQANTVIEQLIKYSEVCPNSIIEVGGHSDSRGNEAHNYLLSKQRARTIANSLIKSGIRKDRLVVEGYGESNPLADNSTEKGQALNRRIEFKYLREGD
ncbi:MAG: OmpA family protein [Methylococcaceae bacterium]|nr:OmpA family protein [Methylococcaceae bacterium]